MFIPRHPVVENQFCKYGSTDTAGGVGNVLAYAGAVIYADADAAGEEAIVYKMDHAGATQTPFGFSMQRVKTGYQTLHPVGFLMPGDLGSSDAVAQPTYDSNGDIDGSDAIPVGIAHLGIWETTHYTCSQSAPGTVDLNMKPGQPLYAAGYQARVTNEDTVNSADGSTGDAGTGAKVNGTTDVVAKVLTGASTAKCEAHIAGTSAFPIRIKLLV